MFSLVSAEVEDADDAVMSLAHCDTYGFNCSHLYRKFITIHTTIIEKEKKNRNKMIPWSLIPHKEEFHVIPFKINLSVLPELNVSTVMDYGAFNSLPKK